MPENLPIIQIAIISSMTGTLLGGFLALIKGKDSWQKIVQLIMTAALAIGALTGITKIFSFSPATIIISGLSLDHLSAIFFFLIDSIGLLAIIYGLKYLQNEKGHYKIGYIQFLSAFFIFGMQLVVLADTPLLFILAWEIMSFSSFLLVLGDLKKSSVRPALFYLVMTHLGAGALIAGFFLISDGNFSINFSKIAFLAVQMPIQTIIIAFLLFFFGFAGKAGLIPLHGWLPEAHPQAPSHISALMSGIMLKMAVYGILRLTLSILPVLPIQLGIVVTIFGLISALFGVLYSLLETDIKRILAMSSIENLGLIFAMIGIFLAAKSAHLDLLAEISLIAAILQSIAHAFYKSGLFFSAGVAVQTFHTRNIEKMGGLAKKMPKFTLAVLLLSLSAAALPPTGAFISEWLILQSIIENSVTAPFALKILLIMTLVFIAVVAGLAVFSMIRFFGLGFLAETRSQDAKIEKELSFSMLAPILILGAGVVLLGAFSRPFITIIRKGFGYQPDSSFLNFNPLVLFTLLLLMIMLAVLLKKVISDSKNRRQYHSWDCGQPIHAGMEYTATAFSAPIRFFFQTIIRARKKVTVTTLTETNPWLVKKSIAVEMTPIWDKYLYNPLVQLIHLASFSIRKLQNGNIQFYIFLILLSLIVTAIISL